MADYTVLPLQLLKTTSSAEQATHHLYLRRHEPRIPDPDSCRSLFAVNLPIDTTELHLRHLFGSQLSSGRVERVEFEDVLSFRKYNKHSTEGKIAKGKKKNKRKMMSADDLQNRLESIQLPSTWNRQLRKSGAHAVIVFVDKASMEAGLKAAKNNNNNNNKIVWGEGIGTRLPPLGMERYLAHEKLRYPDRADLLRTVNDYMVVFSEVAEARDREDAARKREPDEDGFVTVTHGPKMNDYDELKELLQRQEKKDAGLEDFYRFQTRERRKERQNELLRKFGEDKKRLEEMKRRRGKIRVSIIYVCIFDKID